MSGPHADVPGAQPAAQIPARAKFFLCASYALAAWAWRSWEFIVALVLIELYPDSLLMVSAYGLLDNLARVLLGPAVGSYVDRHERLAGAHAMLRLQNLCIGGSAAAALALLWPGSPAAGLKACYWSLMWLLTVLGAASSAGSTGVSIAVEREAVSALCGGEARALAALNAAMRAIDLTALLCAPLAAGVLMTAAGPFAAAAAMAAYCGGAYVPEVLLLGAAFRAAPVLGQAKDRTRTAAGVKSAAGGAAAAADGADADERTGLLAEYDADCAASGGSSRRRTSDGGGSSSRRRTSDGGGDGGKPASRVATAAAVTAAAAVGPLDVIPVCFEGPAGEGPTASSRGRGESRLDSDVDEDEDDEGVDGRRDSVHLSQPLLLPGRTDSTTSSVAPGASRPDGGGGSGLGSPLLRGGGGDSFRSTAAAGRELSISSSVAPLAVSSPTAAGGSGGGGGGGGSAAAGTAARLRAARRGASRHAAAYFDSWVVYGSQPVLPLCLALALLYMTVLSLGFLMTSYLKWSGLSEAEVSGYRGIGALAGLAATAIFPALSARAGLRFCAVAGVTYQLACLAAGVLPVAAAAAAAAGGGGSGSGDGDGGRPSTMQVRIMVAGLVSSRTGLWLYDLAVTQLIQEDVRQDQLGAVYGVQSSLQAAFEMLSFVAGLASPDPARFHWLMLGSLGSVVAATALVWVYACMRRGRAPAGVATGGTGGGAGA